MYVISMEIEGIDLNDFKKFYSKRWRKINDYIFWWLLKDWFIPVPCVKLHSEWVGLFLKEMSICSLKSKKKLISPSSCLVIWQKYIYYI